MAALAVVAESIDNHQDEPLIPDSEKQQLPGSSCRWIFLANRMDKNLRAQVAETVSVITIFRSDGMGL